MLDFIQRDHDIGGQGFDASAAAEILAAGLDHGFPVPAHGGVQSAEQFDALFIGERAAQVRLFQTVEVGAKSHGCQVE